MHCCKSDAEVICSYFSLIMIPVPVQDLIALLIVMVMFSEFWQFLEIFGL